MTNITVPPSPPPPDSHSTATTSQPSSSPNSAPPPPVSSPPNPWDSAGDNASPSNPGYRQPRPAKADPSSSTNHADSTRSTGNIRSPRSTQPEPATPSPVATRTGQLADLDTISSTLHDLQKDKSPVDPQKKFIFINKDSPLIQANGNTLEGSNRLDNMLKYYGIVPSNPKTMEELQAAIDCLQDVRAEISLGLQPEGIDVDAVLSDDDYEKLQQLVHRTETENKTPLLSNLGKELFSSGTHTNQTRTTPTAILERLLRSPTSQKFAQNLLKQLGWYGGNSGETASPEVATKLVLQAIRISLNSPGQEGYVAGYHLASPDHVGKSYQTILSEFKNHLLASGKVASADEAHMATRVLRADFPPDFAIRDIPPDLSYKRSAVWVNFQHGVHLAEALEPGSSRRMSFQELVDLPAQTSDQATTGEQKALIAATRIVPTLDWAAANGIIQKKDTYSPDDIDRAVSALDQHQEEMIKAIQTLTNPMPMRKDYFIGEVLKQSSASKTVYPIAIYDNKKFNDDFHADLKAKKSAYGAIIKNQFAQLTREDQVAIEHGQVSIYALKAKSLYGGGPLAKHNDPVMQRDGFILKSTYKGKDYYYDVNPGHGYIHRRDDLGEAFSASGSILTRDYLKKDNTIQPELIVRNLKRIHDNFHELLEKKLGRKPNLFNLSDARVYHHEYRKYVLEDPYARRNFIVIMPDQLGDRLPASGAAGGSSTPPSFSSSRFNDIATTIADKLFYADENQLFGMAANDPSRVTQAEKDDVQAIVKRHAFLENTGEFLNGLVPFWKPIEDLVAGKTQEGIAGLFLDGLSFLMPVGKFVSGTARAAMQAGKLGLRAALPEFGNVVKSFGISTLRNVNPLDPAVSLAEWAGGKLVKLGPSALTQVNKGIEQFRKISPRWTGRTGQYRFTGGMPQTDPATWKPLATGDELRTVAGIDHVPVRRTGTAASSEQHLIDPHSNLPYGPRVDRLQTFGSQPGNISAYALPDGEKLIQNVKPNTQGIFQVKNESDRNRFFTRYIDDTNIEKVYEIDGRYKPSDGYVSIIDPKTKKPMVTLHYENGKRVRRPMKGGADDPPQRTEGSGGSPSTSGTSTTRPSTTSLPQFQNDFITNMHESYRYDTRPPEEILTTGFSGTVTDNHLLSTFNHNTVFSSRSVDGANLFKDSAIGHGVSNKLYLYKINPYGLRSFSVKDAMQKRMTELTKAISKNQISQNFEKYSSSNKYMKEGGERFFDYVYAKVHDNLDVFRQTDEIHIEGPVTPDRIQYLGESV